MNFERLGDEQPFELGERLADQAGQALAVGVDDRVVVRRPASSARQVVDVEHVVEVDDHHALDHVPELPHVAGPVVGHQPPPGRGRHALDLSCGAAWLCSLMKWSISSGISSRAIGAAAAA